MSDSTSVQPVKTKSTYRPSITAVKAGTPLSIVVIAEGVSAVLEAFKVSVPKEVLYPIVTLAYGIFEGIRNWRKHK